MITRNQNEYKVLSNFLSTATFSDNNYDSTKQPFFMKNALRNPDQTKNDILNINNKISKLKMNGELKKLYQIICNPTIECYINNWTILSLDKVLEKYIGYTKQNQTRAIDFAFIYSGMGHIVVCSYDHQTNKIYYKHDGGSNDYDRVIYFNEACKYEPVSKDLYSFNHLLDQIKKTNLNPFELPMVNK